jgi:hypothetical protein
MASFFKNAFGGEKAPAAANPDSGKLYLDSCGQLRNIATREEGEPVAALWFEVS